MDLLTPYYVSKKEWTGSEYPAIWTPPFSYPNKWAFQRMLTAKQRLPQA